MQNNKYRILIIGGGAAGLMAGIAAARTLSENPTLCSKSQIAILEKMPRPGRKIIITGKGRCNMTNFKDWEDFSAHVHPKPNPLKNAFFNFPPSATVGFFESLGLKTITERGDRVFPETGNSKDVVDTLVTKAKSLGVEIFTGTEVTDIERHEGTEIIDDIGTEGDKSFSIKTADGRIFLSETLIISTGGLSYPTTGSTGDGLKWANELCIKTVKCFPSLTAIVPKGYKYTNEVQSAEDLSAPCHIKRETMPTEFGRLLNGNKLKNISLKIFIDGTEVYDEFGDIDFTDGGLEGPLGFKVSRKCVKAMINGSKVRAVIDMKPAISLSELDKRIFSLSKEMHCRREDLIFNLLRKLLPKDIIKGFLKSNPVTEPSKLGRALKNWGMDMVGYVGYERSVITAGGVSTDEISPKTMESKKIPGLYFAGEILDIDADTGGYNLQIAFSTGCLAGQSAAKKFLL